MLDRSDPANPPAKKLLQWRPNTRDCEAKLCSSTGAKIHPKVGEHTLRWQSYTGGGSCLQTTDARAIITSARQCLENPRSGRYHWAHTGEMGAAPGDAHAWERGTQRVAKQDKLHTKGDTWRQALTSAWPKAATAILDLAYDTQAVIVLREESLLFCFVPTTARGSIFSAVITST